MNALATRHTADERREEIIAAALVAFADTGLDGTSTETIARQVGISQPYLFRLFGTKKELFLAAVERCFTDTIEAFQHAVEEGDQTDSVAKRIGNAYVEFITDAGGRKLRMQMQAYAACDDAAVQDAVQRGFGSLTDYIQGVTGFAPDELARFMATGMLLNVMASMDVLGAESGWGATLREGCMGARE
jgi:AcrR family transcriptional regulator